jgi:hypothetical protein
MRLSSKIAVFAGAGSGIDAAGIVYSYEKLTTLRSGSRD